MVKNLWFNEFLWWLISLIMAICILYPIIYNNLTYEFLWPNFLFILGSITFTRWLFFWHQTPYAWYQLIKIAIIFIMIPTVFICINYFSEFKNFIDEIGLQEIVSNLKSEDQAAMSLYIRNEMILFSISCIISGICVPFKLIWNIWKQYNLGQV
ncbi:MAG: hypothetical protein WBO76_01505 [Saprospiraceae bacterium]